MGFLSSNLCSLLLWSSVVSCWWVMKVGGVDGLTCDSRTSKPCQAMIGYMPSANFNLSSVAALFALNYTSLLGPNDIDPSLPNLSDLVVPPLSKPYLIPQSCGCSGGAYSTSTNYTVVAGDTLSNIAAQFLDFVTYEEIAKVSGIPDPNKILAGQGIVIPLPCACLNASNSLALSYQVQQGDSLDKIAQVYNTSTSQLEAVNLLANASQLEASQVLFVPLPVCKANFSSGALDGNLTVVEGAYELTANGCVRCSCSNGTLHCIPAASSTQSCSNVTCPRSSLVLGASNASQSSQGCSVQSCVYKGYTTQSGILASLEAEQDRQCPAAPAPESFYKPPTGLVTAPAGSPPPPAATTSTSSPPPSPSTPTAAAAPSSNSNSATPLRRLGINSLSWCWCLVIPAVFIM